MRRDAAYDPRQNKDQMKLTAVATEVPTNDHRYGASKFRLLPGLLTGFS